MVIRTITEIVEYVWRRCARCLGIKEEDWHSITFPDGWDWDSLEKFLTKDDKSIDN